MELGDYSLEEVLQEAARRSDTKKAQQSVADLIMDTLFSEQSAFVQDKSKRKAALCSRRAGKTFSCARYLTVMALLHPGSICVYITLSRKLARRLLWPELKSLNREMDLGLHFNNVELEVTFPNGSQIWLTGANDRSEIEKLRGPKYILCVLDECASFGEYLEELVEDVLEPATLDMNGTICLIGTPAAHCTGKFYDATTDPIHGWSIHSWTVLDNPHVPHARDWLDRRMKEKGWSDTHPTYMREWRGLWVRSNDSMVYRWHPECRFDTVPDHDDWQYVIGVDLGFEDATAFSIAAFNNVMTDVWFVDEFKESHLIPADVAAQLLEYISIYDPISIVCDTGGLGKSIAEELRQRYSIPVKPAQKSAKLTAIELFNGELDARRIHAKKDSRLVTEWRYLQWDENRRKPREDSRFDNHLADASLYAFRECTSFLNEPLVNHPQIGDPDYGQFESKRMEKQLADRIRKQVEEKDYEAELWGHDTVQYYIEEA